MNKILKSFNKKIFSLTELLFATIPVALILSGFAVPFLIIVFCFFNKSINLSDILFIFLGIILATIGFQWDDAIINHYGTSMARKRNSEKWELERKKNTK